MFWGEAAWEIGDTHSVYVSASYFTIGQAGGPGSSVSSDLEHIAGVTSGLHHQSISPASAGNDRASLKHRVPMLGDGNTAISTAQETMILFWLDWKSLLGPPARGHFFGGCMFATDISLKYGTHQPETILAHLSIEEASEIIREKLRAEVRSELEGEYEDRIYYAEEEASEWESRADDYESDATQLAMAIRDALDAESLDDAKIILERVKRDLDNYF
ncbi:hypothetical protein ABK734_05260 [Enterobacter sp. KE9933]|uniref:hypothetical protein n=2 Tax=Enterobacter TaxID=547 RepID=UPI003752FE08